ncbi:MAG: NUDIX domain-containing protein [Clostridia bacterium]|nr:NUDIX domain-containing protein [Clostridia bacterium]
MPEYLDVYDYDGNKRGFSVERGKHHHEDWWYLCIHAYIFTPDGKFLIQRRSPKKQYFPNIWDITCGAANSGETSLEAAIREVKEELGLDVSGFETSFVGVSHCYDCVNHVYFFKGEFTLDDLTLQEDEVVDAKFVEKDELIDLIVNSEFKDGEYHKMIEDYINGI